MIILVLIIVQARGYVFKQLQNQAMSISASAASEINGDLVEQIKVRDDEKKPAYEQLRTYLRKIRDANRNKNIYIKYIYITYPSPTDPKQFLFGIDPEEAEKDVSHAGDPNPGATADFLYDHLNTQYSYPKMIEDKWGTWLTGYAPIYNSKGVYVGTIGVDISAAFVHNVLNQLILSGGIALAISLILTFIGANYLANRATFSLSRLNDSIKEIGKGNLGTRVELMTDDEFQELANAINAMCKGLQEKERLRAGFAHYVSQHAMERIAAAKGSLRLGGEKRKITVFFSDIRNFGTLSERLSPEEIISILNEYFNTMLEIVFRHHGMFDKFIGDAIMIEFGVPDEDINQEKNAVLTALEMQQAMVILSSKWKNEGKPVIEIGIGIHTGEALVSKIGYDKRMEFSAIGDTLDIASQIEGATRVYNEQIIVSESTFTALKNEFPSKFLGPLTIPGKDKQVNAYAILGTQQSLSSSENRPEDRKGPSS
jgi:adenylate cyclase